MTISNSEAGIFITGTSGFIGFHLARKLLDKGCRVLGYDGMTDYYDVSLKKSRLDILSSYPRFSFIQGMLEDQEKFFRSVLDFAPGVLVHLAAQAGVRYSLENPHAYIQSNLVGTMNVLEAARQCDVGHLMMASTSSVYGANREMPFTESQKTDTQLTIYASTKKANESMSHAYSHLWKIPTTVFRFFTVYGPWGRPDMALFKFVDAMLEGGSIDIYNRGNMYRDFTYIDDLVTAITLLMDCIPKQPPDPANEVEGDSLSHVAPWRVVNIGNSSKVQLMQLIEAIESYLGTEAEKKFLAMQPGDVPATWADASLLRNLTAYSPSTNIEVGVAEFIDWFRDYYKK